MLRKNAVFIFIVILLFSSFVLDVPVRFSVYASASDPTVLDVNVSADSVRREDYIYLIVNASDVEDDESELELFVEHNSGSGWSSIYMDLPSDTVWDPEGWLLIKFSPAHDAQHGFYDFRIRAQDTEGDYNFLWFEANALVEVTTEPLIEVLDVSFGSESVKRNETLTIFLNASMVREDEDDLIPNAHYRVEGGPLTAIPFENMNYHGTPDEGYWVIRMTPHIYSKLGPCEFICSVENSSGYGSSYKSFPDALTVENNEPRALNISVEGDSVERGNTIYVYADGEDLEDTKAHLEPCFGYRMVGDNWTFACFEDPFYLGSTNIWRMSFSPIAEESFTLGSYDVCVMFKDSDGGTSDIIYLENAVEVKNSPPVVGQFTVARTRGFRLQSMTIVSDGFDWETHESDLVPTFQYRGPSGGWVNHTDNGSYFLTDPGYWFNHWQMMFLPPADAELGVYDFRVQYSDGIDNSSWAQWYDGFTLRNSPPEIESIAASRNLSVILFTFSADAHDDEGSPLNYEWDFGDGGTSEEQTPTHAFMSSGTFVVTLTVTDEEGAQEEDWITVDIPEGRPDADEDGLSDFEEVREGTDPENWDSDGDGIGDKEDAYPLDPGRWREPIMEVFIVILVLAVINVVLLFLLINSKLNKREKDQDKKE